MSLLFDALRRGSKENENEEELRIEAEIRAGRESSNRAREAMEKAMAALAAATGGTPVPPAAVPRPSRPSEPPAPPRPEAKKAKTILELEKEAVEFIDKMNLRPLLPPEFATLTSEQRVKVIQDLKKRIVDIVKTDARIQYSEEQKQSGKVAKVRATINKEFQVKNLETDIFHSLALTNEGRQLIADDLASLVRNTRSREVQLSPEGNIVVSYINPAELPDMTPEDSTRIQRFNAAANAFTALPYEWGQDNKHQREYEQARIQYLEAQREALSVLTQVGGRDRAILKIAEIDHAVQMDQLINTHPEFEEELEGLSKGGTFKEELSDVWNVGGKGRMNKAILVGGYFARVGARGAALAAQTNIALWAAAGTVGGVIGGFRGRVRAKETLKENRIRARHGQRDESKERARMVDVIRLTAGLNKMSAQLETAQNSLAAIPSGERAALIAKLNNLIGHAQDQLEKGQINFGDGKSSLSNQFNFIQSLNRALVLKESMFGQANLELNARIRDCLNEYSKNKSKIISEAQASFLNRQMWKGALIGAGAATIGYTVRHIGEQLGWWEKIGEFWRGEKGGQAAQVAAEKPETDAGESFIARAKNWLSSIMEEDKKAQPDLSKYETTTRANPFGPQARPGIDPDTHAHSPGQPPPARPQPAPPPRPQTVTPPPEATPPRAPTPPPAEPQKPAPQAPTEKPRMAQPETQKPAAPPEKPRIKIAEPQEPRAARPPEPPEAKPTPVPRPPALPPEPKEFDISQMKTPGVEPISNLEDLPGEKVYLDYPSFDPEHPVAPFNPAVHGLPGEEIPIQPPETEPIAGVKTPGVEPLEKLPGEEIPIKPPEAFEEARQKVLGGYEQTEGIGGRPRDIIPRERVPNPMEMEAQRARTPGFRPYNPPSGVPYQPEAYVRGYNSPYGGHGHYGFHTATEYYPDLTERENLLIRTDEDFAKNPFRLHGKSLIEAYNRHYANLHRIFPSEADMRMWESTYSDMKVKNILKDPAMGEQEMRQGTPYGKLYRHLKVLLRETGLKPKGANLIRWKSETVEDYIARATQRAAKLGRLAAIKIPE